MTGWSVFISSGFVLLELLEPHQSEVFITPQTPEQLHDGMHRLQHLHI